MRNEFRDPAGALLTTQTTVLAEQVRGGMQEDLVRTAIDELMRFYAVSGGDPAEAAARVIDSLRARLDSAGDGRPADRPLDRIRELALEAFGRHRAGIEGIRTRELERSRFVETRVRRRAGAA